ncbi:MAG: hypothetical protein U5Q16_10740 [Gammaproteobacteria bacterium]|nr:hypothetical protein [Gammaproteobacteria bacterium]
MLEKIAGKLKAAEDQARQTEAGMAEQFDDPIARKTGWTRLHGGGSSGRTRKLSENSTGQIRVVNTLRGLILPIVFGLAAIALVTFGTIDLFRSMTSDAVDMSITGFLVLLFAAAFVSLPAYLTLRPKERLTFDKASGYFWRGRKPASLGDSDEAHRLERIKGLQILPKYIQKVSQGRNDSYWSYEFNLILDDHERMLVTDHGDRRATRADAEKLARILDVPVFEASQ